MLRLLRVLAVTVAALVPSACDGRTVPALQRTAEAFLPILEGFADEAVRIHVTAAFREKAPALFDLLDADHDGNLTVAEAFAVPERMQDPLFAVACSAAIARLVLDPKAERK